MKLQQSLMIRCDCAYCQFEVMSLAPCYLLDFSVQRKIYRSRAQTILHGAWPSPTHIKARHGLELGNAILVSEIPNKIEATSQPQSGARMRIPWPDLW